VDAGGKAAILDLAEEAGEKAVKELGENSFFHKTDVTSEEDVSGAIEKALSAFGEINVLVNCAGIASAAKTVGKKGPFDLGVFEMTIKVNLIGTFNVTRLAALKMSGNSPGEDGERGVIVNTASVAAFDGQVGQAAYSASKAGVVGMTLPVARDLAQFGIRNVTIAPGIFETPMAGLMQDKVRESLERQVPFPQRFGKPEEFAGLVCEIIRNRMINGETIRLDGAIRMAPR
jgi:NAD(P)-dependent dehydrogenase (short-subunit alcohol dehydrogenase family)